MPGCPSAKRYHQNGTPWLGMQQGSSFRVNQDPHKQYTFLYYIFNLFFSLSPPYDLKKFTFFYLIFYFNLLFLFQIKKLKRSKPMKRSIFILEYRKLDDFRYSALGFGEFCEIPQGVTVTQQASGLLRNARGVKPLWKISALALILFTFLFIINITLYSKKTKELRPTEKKAVYNFTVTDPDDVPEADAVIKLTHKNSTIKGTTDINGKFSALLDKGKPYKVSVVKFNKTFPFKDINIPIDDEYVIIDKKYRIKLKISYLEIYTFNNVYFKFNKHILRPTSFKELNKLVKQMRDNTKMTIEIAGHTDNVGDDKHNMQLSQQRVNSVKNYLVKKGISKHRIIAKGYGETNPVTTNKTEVGRKRNRRVEARIITE